MDDIYQKIDELLKNRTHDIAALINSDVTSRFYWTTCQAECFHLITKTIEEVLEIAGPETSEWGPGEKAMRVFLSRLDYGMQLASKRGWSLRQIDIARNGGAIVRNQTQEQPEGVWVDSTDGPVYALSNQTIYTIIAFQDGIPEVCSTRSNIDYSKSDWAEFLSTEKNIDRFGAESLMEKINLAWRAGYWSVEDGYELRILEDVIDQTEG